MAQLIVPGQSKQATLQIWDDVTNLQVSGWFTNISITSSDSSKATAAPNTTSSDGRLIDFTGVSAGDATITITATANYQNSVGDWVAQVKTVSVDMHVQNNANSTSLKVAF